MKKSIILVSLLVVAVPAIGFSPYVANPVANGGPANDAFDDAETVLAVFAGTGSNVGATLQAGELRPCGATASTVWYSFINVAPTAWEVNTFGSSYDTVVAAYTGSAMGALTLKACNDDAGGVHGLDSKILFSAGPGETVHLQVGGYFGRQGDIALQIYPSQAGAVLDQVFV